MDVSLGNITPVLSPLDGIVTQILPGVSGGPISIGQSVYLNPSGQFQLAFATTKSQALVLGIALGTVFQPNAPIIIATGGDVNVQSVLTTTSVFILSGNNPGGVAPQGDFASGWYPSIIGIAVSPSILRLGIVATNTTPKP